MTEDLYELVSDDQGVVAYIWLTERQVEDIIRQNPHLVLVKFTTSSQPTAS